MTREDLKEAVDGIIAIVSDDEAAHSMEDDLHIQVIFQFCPVWVRKEIMRLSKASFNRWCA